MPRGVVPGKNVRITTGRSSAASVCSFFSSSPSGGGSDLSHGQIFPNRLALTGRIAGENILVRALAVQEHRRHARAGLDALRIVHPAQIPRVVDPPRDVCQVGPARAGRRDAEHVVALRAAKAAAADQRATCLGHAAVSVRSRPRVIALRRNSRCWLPLGERRGIERRQLRRQIGHAFLGELRHLQRHPRTRALVRFQHAAQRLGRELGRDLRQRRRRDQFARGVLPAAEPIDVLLRQSAQAVALVTGKCS